MIQEYIAATGIFFFILLAAYALMQKALALALKDADSFDDDIQKSLTAEDYVITRRDKAFLVAGTIFTVVTPFFRDLYPSIVGYYVIATVLLVAAIVDLKVRYAPDSFSVAFLAVAVFDIVFYGVPVSSAFIGMLFPGLAFFLACAFKPDLIGGADIKMLITLGACLGTLQTTSLYLMSCIVLCTLYVPLWLKGKLEKNEKPIFIPAIFGFYVAYMLVQYEPQYLQLFDI